jgi:hypothetical protein
MRKTLEVGFATIILALCLTKAAGQPLEGTWEGKIDGRKAVTLKLAETGGHWEGHVIFYVLDKKFSDADAQVVGQSERDLNDLKWDGEVLRFSSQDPDVAFEVTVTGSRTAVLKRLKPELVVPMERQ